jgi:putative beta-lysine N-acetyltransferase
MNADPAPLVPTTPTTPTARPTPQPPVAPARPARARKETVPGDPDSENLPRPLGHKRTTGRVRLVLDEGEKTEAMGIVYGLDHEIRAPGYRVKVFLDSYNRRIKVVDYRATDYEALILKLRFLAEANRFDKIWIKARGDDWEQFLRHGYLLEGVLKHFDRGRPAYIVSKFRSQRRIQSKNLMKEILLIEKIMARKERGAPKPLPDGYVLDYARESDLEGMLQLYRRVFKTYPSPLTYRDYLTAVLHRDAIFRVIRRGNVVVSVASAEFDPIHLAAELTDCATHPEERGRGLMSNILVALEEDLRARKYRCAYSLARAASFGMNAAFHGLGYEFNGRMINNCDIYGAFEDMNLWVKNLRAGSRNTEEAVASSARRRRAS